MGAFREQANEARAAMGAVFRNPGLRRIQLAFAGSIIGDWAYAVAVSVWLYDRSGAGAVGALGVARYLAMALATPFMSSLADHLPRRTVMVASDLVRVVTVAAAAVVIEADGPVAVVVVLAVVTSVLGTAFRPAQAALLPQLVREAEELTAANVASSTIESVGFFAGPALAGLLLGATDVATVYAFNAATFLWSAVLVLSVRKVIAAEPAKERAERPKLFSGVGAGFTTIFRNRDLRLIVGLYTAQTVVAGASLVFEVAIALDLLELDESGLGFLSATLGIGGFLGGFVALMLSGRSAMARHFGIGVVLWGVPLLLVVISPTVAAAVAAMVLIGLGNSVVDINADTMLQRVVPADVMARVFGAMHTALIVGMAVGSFTMPLLIDGFGLRTALAVLGIAIAGLVALGYAGLHRIDHTTMAPRGLDLLASVPLFSPLPRRLQERLARSAVVVELPPDEVLFREGDVGDRFYVVEQGTVRVSRRDGVTAELGRGDHFGEIALLRDAPRNATITATSAVTLLALDRDVFLPAVTSHGDALGAADHTIALRLAIS